MKAELRRIEKCSPRAGPETVIPRAKTGADDETLAASPAERILAVDVIGVDCRADAGDEIAPRVVIIGLESQRRLIGEGMRPACEHVAAADRSVLQLDRLIFGHAIIDVALDRGAVARVGPVGAE